VAPGERTAARSITGIGMRSQAVAVDARFPVSDPHRNASRCGAATSTRRAATSVSTLKRRWVALLHRARVVAIELVDLQADGTVRKPAPVGVPRQSRIHVDDDGRPAGLVRSRGADSRSALTMLDLALRYAVPDIPG